MSREGTRRKFAALRADKDGMTAFLRIVRTRTGHGLSKHPNAPTGAQFERSDENRGRALAPSGSVGSSTGRAL